MNILMIASEAVPFCKTGGVADVVYGLAKELCGKMHDVRIAIPCYRGILDRSRMTEIIPALSIPLGTYFRKASIWKAEKENQPLVYLIQEDFYFGRNDMYGFLDDYERFIFFTRAILEMLPNATYREKENNWFPDIIQGYDWIVGMIPAWLPIYETMDPRFRSTRFTLFVHNISKLGITCSRALPIAQQEGNGTFDKISESVNRINFLGRGVLFADKVITVNPRYNASNPLPEAARPMEKIFLERLEKKQAIGIRNAIDYEEFDPFNDKAICSKFSEQRLFERSKNKLAFQKELHFEENESIPLIGMVSRLMATKGFDLMPSLKGILMNINSVQFVILADPAEPNYRKMLEQWEQEWNQQRQINNLSQCMQIFYGFDDHLARKIYAGCDIFLLPSKEEPSNIQQYIAMHYGAIPIVHHSGPLRDSVIQYEPGIELSKQSNQGNGIGFTFNEFEPDKFCNAVISAINLFNSDKAIWKVLQRHNMHEDFSWFRPADEYVDIFKQALQSPKVAIDKGTPLKLERNAQLLQAILEIDSLVNQNVQDKKEIIKHAARLIREVMQSNAVYIWELSKIKKQEAPDVETTLSQSSDDDKLQIVGDSILDRQISQNQPEWKEINELLNRGTIMSWKQFNDFELCGICQSILGFRDSKLAIKMKWSDSRTAPISAHGHIIGKIDVVFAETILKNDYVWVDYALTILANILGIRLESIRKMSKIDEIFNMNIEMLQTHLLNQTEKVVLKWAKHFSNADDAWLYLIKGNELEQYPLDPNRNSSKEIADQAKKQKEIIYIPDWNAKLTNNKSEITFRSLMAIPLLDRQEQCIGVVTIVHKRPAMFSRNDERILQEHLAPEATEAIKRAILHEESDRSREIKLQKLTTSLVAGKDFSLFLHQVLKTTAEVLEARAASLFLVNKEKNILKIEAAFGNHIPLLAQGASYKLGEGTTGKIWENGEIFKADSNEDLHGKSGWRGKYSELQGEPNAFLGIPLKIEKEVIGVLKLEDRRSTDSLKDNTTFSEEDVRLAEMMANVIATVIFNLQVGEKRLQVLSNNLGKLSSALAGSQDKQTLMDNIVNTIAEVLQVDAATLFLSDESDEKTPKLIIQAAYGYQKPLLDAKISYNWGEGVTGRIAQTNLPFQANSLDILREKGGSEKGKFDDLQKGKRPASFYGFPLRVQSREKPIGVLKVESLIKRPFTIEDVLLIKMMGNVIATVVYNAQEGEKRLQELSTNLDRLSFALAGSQDMQTLMDNIVNTIAEVLKVDAATLFLSDEESQKLIIQAAYGYQKPLLDAKITYNWGEGVTGRIAQTNLPFHANSLDVLREKGGSEKGKYDNLQEGKRPASFYGYPLRVQSREKPIGVLKVESLIKRPFTSEDVLLIEMMCNVIATVVYNAQAEKEKLEGLSKDIGNLSKALARGQDMKTLFKNIVDTIAQVVNAEASSLYLIDNATGKLVIRAATGYQKELVDKKVAYCLGEGITGWIAEKNVPVKADTLAQLQNHPAHKGKQDKLQHGKKPNSFLGLPLKAINRNSNQEEVLGVLKVENIIQSKKHPENHFTEQDTLLVAMMANVIAAVISTARWGEERIGQVIVRMGTLSMLKDASKDLMYEYAKQDDSGVRDQLAAALAKALDSDYLLAIREAESLFQAGAVASLYLRISEYSGDLKIQWWFHLLYDILQTHKYAKKWEEIQKHAKPWQLLKESMQSPEDFASRLQLFLAEKLSVLDLHYGEIEHDPHYLWCVSLLDTESVFGNPIPKLPLCFYRDEHFDDESISSLIAFFRTINVFIPKVIVIVNWNAHEFGKEVTVAQLKVRDNFDVIVIKRLDFMGILESVDPRETLQKYILRHIRATSPFIIFGKVPDGMFFGRENELRILKDGAGIKNFAIIGNRRIGKTSLLKRLFKYLEKSEVIFPLYVDCQGIGEDLKIITWLDFLKGFVLQTGIPLPDYKIQSFISVLRELGQKKKKPTILIDEVDLLLKSEGQDEPFISKVRSVTQEGVCNFIFCGSTELAKNLRNNKSSIFNFLQPFPLGCLERESSRRLLTEPLETLDIAFDTNEIIDKIIDISSGHPCVIQFIGNMLVNAVNKRPERRRILLSDWEKIEKDSDFINLFLDSVYKNLDTREKLIVQVAPSTGFHVQDIDKALESFGVNMPQEEVDASLDLLVDLKVFNRENTDYEFVLRAFPEIFRKSQEIERIIKQTIRLLPSEQKRKD